MGGFIDCGIGLDTKTSPRRAAIEKAQAELRQEYDVREERKRELEFLEKGGNPLDFKFGSGTSISLQSTSFTDHHAEQYVISEAKGSFALAASPHGDSIESSGRPGGSVGKEPNIADNLLLFDGENSKPRGDRNGKRTGKRGLQLEKSNAKETEDSLIFHLGVKRQAYTRRNRTRPSRDSHMNKPTVPSSLPDHRDGKKSSREGRAENHGISASNSKPASPDVNSKVLVSDNQFDMQPDEVQVPHIDEVREEVEGDVSENIQDKNHSSQNLPSEQIGNFTASRPDDLTGKDNATSVERTGNVEDTGNAEKVGDSSIPDKASTVLDNDMIRNNSVITSLANTENNTVGSSNNNNHGRVKSAEGSPAGDSKESSAFQRTSDNNVVREESMLIGAEAPVNGNAELRPTARIKNEVELCNNTTKMSNEVKPLANNMESLKTNGDVLPKPERKLDNSLVDSSHSINKAGVITSSLVLPTCEPLTTASSTRSDTTTLKLGKKSNEDAILKEARIIRQANLKRVGLLSTYYKPPEKRKKCHWDFVLEEMAWMANDFMQERLWKRAAATHMSHQIAASGRSKFEQNIICRKQRYIARTLAKAVMYFWRSADVVRISKEAHDHAEGRNSDPIRTKVNGTTAEKDQGSKAIEVENNSHHHAIQAYAVRFLKYDCSSSNDPILAEAPTTPDRINDAGTLKMEDESSEESLFYRVPPGAMQQYRESMESQWMNDKKKDNSMHQEDCEASLCDSLPDVPRENEYEEEEGETGSYYLPEKFDGTVSSKFTLKKKKNFPQKSYRSRQYDGFSDFPYDPYLEGKSQNQALVFTGKRPSSTLNAGSIPTKRHRSVPRQRTVGPFSAGGTGSVQITNKTDASSGDTNSFQDDQSSMHGGSKPWKNMEVESTMDYEKQLPFDSCEISTKSKKKSKPVGYSTNHLDSGGLVVLGKGSMYDQRLQSDSLVQHEQREQVKKRLESPHFESNGKIGIYGQHASKKPKLIKQLTEPSPDGIISPNGSMLSPVTSQTSNMPNQKKLIKIIASRERGRKSKAMKMAAGQLGSGISWTTLEDQALVVLVHDMGPNWELVSDAINSTLQFKCIFRKPKECRERHKFLIDQSAGDGADSAEDSGSSQPYPSTLPGIPKGSAGQLFQRLQGPMVEDTLKAHFEKIILIEQKLRSCRSQKDTRELKQITPIHSSHVVALSQTCPNNLAGGILSPLDLCNAISSNPDVIAHGSQGSHTGSAPLPNHQGSLSPVLSTSSVNTMLQGSSGIVLGSNIPSPSTALNAPVRDAPKYGMPRMASLPGDDQQRSHYARMIPGRNNQQSGVSVPGALPLGVDRGAYILPSGNGMMGGRAIPRTGFQGISSPGMPVVSGGSVLAGGGVGMSNPSNVLPVPVSGPKNSMLRPHDSMSMLRPGQNTEDRRQAMMQDLQLQVSPGNSPAIPSFNSLSTPFSTATGIPSIPPYPSQQPLQPHQISHQPHVLGTHHHPHIHSPNQSGGAQQQAYAIRRAKERQLQRMMPQSQQPYPSSTSVPPVQSNSQQEQQQTQHKQPVPRGPQPDPAGMPNQATKQRQRQPKQILQQQNKLMKGLGRGAAMMHQTLTVDPSQIGNPTAAPRNQGFFPSSSGVNTGLPQPSNHNKMFSSRPPQSSKQMPPLPSHSDALLSSVSLAAQKQRQMMIRQQNRQLPSEGRIQPSCDQARVINQTPPITSIPPPPVSSDAQWRPESSHDSSTPSSTGQLAGSPPEKLVAPEKLVPSSSEGSEQRQFTRSISMDGRGGGAQRPQQQQQQQQPLLQSSQQQQQQAEHSGLHQNAVQGNLHERPSNVGSG